MALRVAKMPAPPNPYPAPPVASSTDGNLFTRLGAFLNELFGADTVSAAPLAVDVPVGEVYFLLSDHLGSTTMTLGINGSVVSETRYGAWGNTRYISGTSPTDRKYTGQIEEQAGLYFYNARWYDSSLARFIQADTLILQPGNPLALDRYSYTYNNPVRYSDSTGHCIDGVTTFLCIAMAAGAVAEYAVQVSENLNQGMDLGEALTTNISAEKILGGAVIAGGVIIGAAAVSVGLAAVGITTGAACMDGDCTNEVKVIQGGLETIQVPKSTNLSTPQMNPLIDLGTNGKSDSGLLHILERHWSTSGTTEVSHFSSEITIPKLYDLIKSAGGDISLWTKQGSSYVRDFNAGGTIGTDAIGATTAWMRVVVDSAGRLITAYPISEPIIPQ